jgi:putative oxidoreductase
MRYSVPIGRLFFSAIFILGSFANFHLPAIQMAAQHGVPDANVLVPLSGVMALVGGLSVLFGIRARLGALLLIAFLVPVTLAMHNFWAFSDPGARMVQQINFMKNLALLGGSLLVVYFGAGPVSVDEWLAEHRTARHLRRAHPLHPAHTT